MVILVAKSFASGIVEEQKKKLSPPSFQLLTSQTGFAPIALVILLLFGIAAGTLLVQNGVNFLPKAQQSTSECTAKEIENCKYEGATACKTSSGYHYCVDDGGNFCIENTAYIHPKSDKYAINCATNPRYKDTPRCGFDKEFESYTCISQISYNKWRQSIAESLAGDGKAPPGECTPDYNKNTCEKNGKTGGCYQDSSGNPVCLYGKTQQCSSAPNPNRADKKSDQQICKDLNTECKIVGGEPRCVGLEECSADDKRLCSNCKIITRDNQKISYCPGSNTCTDGWWNYCYVAYKKGCTPGNDGIPICEGDPDPRNVTKKPSAGTPAAPGGGAAPPAGAAPAKGTPPAPATVTSVSTNCGTDANGIQIPCFKIGVFDEATLQATIADARIASLNYDLYTRIITDLKQYVNTSQAEAKTAAAKQAANQCINNTRP